MSCRRTTHRLCTQISTFTITVTFTFPSTLDSRDPCYVGLVARSLPQPALFFFPSFIHPYSPLKHQYHAVVAACLSLLRHPHTSINHINHTISKEHLRHSHMPPLQMSVVAATGLGIHTALAFKSQCMHCCRKYALDASNTDMATTQTHAP
ncbi:hypothetical protein CDEST_10803 [Colletotrichum destructivum]|uniref:Uncharacterized protein n=1 Tax=Colletotrichum destructivum TaxID=34406 RepID=A0AAX4IRB2_9PEZI|nr:hypothetical protein CDEST_10803 [Colletotrichum destructivum]